MRRSLLFTCALLCATTSVEDAQQQPGPMLRGTLLHAHNCYPEQGRFEDRLARALGTAPRPLAIEQDLVWDEAAGEARVSHGAPLRGDEPTLAAHFFAQVTPLVERALVERQRESWPLLVLHLDFKSNEPAHHRAVWDLLGRHEHWLSTAERVADTEAVAPIRVGPVLVLTENGPGQAEVFHDQVPVGARLRVFGTTSSRVGDLSALSREAQAARLVSASPAELLPSRATNYRRWSNHPWTVVERGGQSAAGEWTAGDEARLSALVARARAQGLWLRFYTLNGYASNDGEGLAPSERLRPERAQRVEGSEPDGPPTLRGPQGRPEQGRGTTGAGQGWSATYNFGSLAAVEQRWDAVIRNGVELVATDQYELFSERLRRVRP